MCAEVIDGHRRPSIIHLFSKYSDWRADVSSRDQFSFLHRLVSLSAMFVNKCRRLFAITSFRVYMSKLTGAQPQNLQKESYEFFLLTLKTKRTHVSYNTRTFFLSFNVDVRLRTNLRIVSKTVPRSLTMAEGTS